VKRTAEDKAASEGVSPDVDKLSVSKNGTVFRFSLGKRPMGNNLTVMKTDAVGSKIICPPGSVSYLGYASKITVQENTHSSTKQ
jgi:hypothetical protein